MWPTPGGRGTSRVRNYGGGAIASAPGSTVTVTARPRPRWRKRLWQVLVALCVVAALGAGAFLLATHEDADPDSVAAVPSDAVAVPDAVLPELSDPAPVLAALSTDAPAPTAAGLQAVLAPLLAAPALGSGASAEVVDVATGATLLDTDADDPGTPASTAKLLTGLAALTTLGPGATIPTSVVAGAVPGEVVLVGGGDPTLSTTSPSSSYPGAATVADLAAQVQAALGGTAVTSVVVDNSLFTGPLTAPGWGSEDAPSTYAAPVTATAVDGARVDPGQSQRSGQPGTDAGTALAAALGAPGAAVTLGTAPAGAAVLGTVRSAPVERLVEQALTASDNLLAETLARQVALATGGEASFTGAAAAVTAAVGAAGFDTSGLTLTDGSGLSGTDRVPARLLVDVLEAAADGTLPVAGALLSGLPIAGYTGTLADRGDADPATAPGTVRAKTGTLATTSALAGLVVTEDGRLLAFALLADGTPGNVVAAEAALDAVAAAMASCGC
ncbi:D-alanyl-D-alanine carboxypeptidase / D-alanyl-D-alanine-endopeptidase (penicillin-binding protein 4) [Klenkia soli]|uniref:D-alanyl-D-alanine carboxypeptidase / D-alanyl-D-alanine-endopeptidase (Penicillin-binding protein 4) n=1 Tax=Klenkia soli TaxID=1052260 RepID=A0A1H0NH68_9ACTN|nr:D-alanyl-D-alanine carboxypeptidase/D-alanyl-D-alanine-endopeptidase [Klenkia soli]SDO91680.1 D-alanyl-D-alanine carboxypeptidase / D-alanyl-D-alanine-endopeptidase (penicillin-binding protein 4) [Klenkia soli]